MKIKILSLAIIAFAATGLQAQEKAKPTQDAAVIEKRGQDATTASSDQRSLQTARELGLDEKQTESLKQVNRQFDHEMSMLASSGMEKEQLQKRSAELDQQRNTRLQYLFTPEQYEKYKTMNEKTKAESLQKEADINKATAK